MGLDLAGVALAPALALVVPALLILGFALKQTPQVPDWSIVWAMLVGGSIAGLLTIGYDVNGLSNGLIAGGMAIAANQVFKQTKERE